MGATLTLDRVEGNLLIAFTAVFVSVVAERFWRIACLFVIPVPVLTSPQCQIVCTDDICTFSGPRYSFSPTVSANDGGTVLIRGITESYSDSTHPLGPPMDSITNIRRPYEIPLVCCFKISQAVAPHLRKLLN